MKKTTKKKIKKVESLGEIPELLKDVELTKEVVETPQDDLEPVINVNNCEYFLSMTFNADTFQCYTNNLKIGILSFKPFQVSTEGYIKIQKNGSGAFEKKLTLIQLKQLFDDMQTLEIFLNTFYSLYGAPSNKQSM